MAGETDVAQKINVIILGASGSGKSTIGNRITGIEKFNINKFSREIATSHCVTVTKTNRSLTYQLTVVEVNFSMYVKDLYSYTQSVFKDSEIHLVLFVLRKGRLTFADSQFQDEILRQVNIDLLSPIFALIITHCELEEIRENVISLFKSENKNVSNLFEKGIFSTGFPVLAEYQQENPSIIERLKDSMQKDQKTLDHLIVSLFAKDAKKELHNNLIRKTNSFVFWVGYFLQFVSEEQPDSSSCT